MIWLQVTIATLVGFACGFWLALEVGRIIYNRKMDAVRAEVDSQLAEYVSEQRDNAV